MGRTKPVAQEIYHVYNRGVDKRDIFLGETDYMRFAHGLFEFNDLNPVLNLCHYLRRQPIEIGSRYGVERPRKLLVELLAFCLLPNHFHLLMRQKVDNGISEFMRKLGIGYTGYFNAKHDRSGHLFQGKYKFVRIARESHFVHIPYYIHGNPLDLIEPGWRDGKIKNPGKAMRFLDTYRWSSHQDYIGKKNFPSLTQRELLTEFWGGPGQYRKGLARWLGDMQLEAIEGLTLE